MNKIRDSMAYYNYIFGVAVFFIFFGRKFRVQSILRILSVVRDTAGIERRSHGKLLGDSLYINFIFNTINGGLMTLLRDLYPL